MKNSTLNQVRTGPQYLLPDSNKELCRENAFLPGRLTSARTEIRVKIVHPFASSFWL